MDDGFLSKLRTGIPFVETRVEHITCVGDSTRATRVESVILLVYSGNFKDKCTQSEKCLARVDYIKFNFLRFSKAKGQ